MSNDIPATTTTKGKRKRVVEDTETTVAMDSDDVDATTTDVSQTPSSSSSVPAPHADKFKEDKPEFNNPVSAVEDENDQPIPEAVSNKPATGQKLCPLCATVNEFEAYSDRATIIPCGGEVGKDHKSPCPMIWCRCKKCHATTEIDTSVSMKKKVKCTGCSVKWMHCFGKGCKGWLGVGDDEFAAGKVECQICKKPFTIKREASAPTTGVAAAKPSAVDQKANNNLPPPPGMKPGSLSYSPQPNPKIQKVNADQKGTKPVAQTNGGDADQEWQHVPSDPSGNEKTQSSSSSSSTTSRPYEEKKFPDNTSLMKQNDQKFESWRSHWFEKIKVDFKNDRNSNVAWVNAAANEPSKPIDPELRIRVWINSERRCNRV